MLTNIQQDTVIDRVNNLLNIANDILTISEELPPLKTIHISYNLKGTTAGQAIYTTSKKLIKLNKVLISENFEHFINDTIPHEVAHLIVRHYFHPNLPAHGKTWKYIMKHVFNTSPERCHELNTVNSIGRNVKKYIYNCSCNDGILHYIGVNKHNKIQNGKRYFCKSCSSSIIYTNDITDSKTLIKKKRMI